jgi:hypothetical protein
MLGSHTHAGIAAATASRVLGTTPAVNYATAADTVFSGAASDAKKSLSFCQPIKEMSTGLLKTFKREINTSHIYQVTKNGKTYVCFVHDKPEKQHSTVDNSLFVFY